MSVVGDRGARVGLLAEQLLAEIDATSEQLQREQALLVARDVVRRRDAALAQSISGGTFDYRVLLPDMDPADRVSLCSHTSCASVADDV